MKPHRSILAVFLCLLLPCLIVGYLLLIADQGETLFHDIPEKQWIEELEYGDSDQVDLWHGFGTEGVAVLMRGWERAQRPGARLYRQTYRNMSRSAPDWLMKMLPAPKQDTTRSTRMRIVSLLSSLSKDAMGALPVMIDAIDDENMSVRSLAVNYFTWGEDDQVLLTQLNSRQREQILKLLLDGFAKASSNNTSFRNNVMLALRYFPEEKIKVIPILVEGLKDSDLHIRMVALISLVKLDKQQANIEGAVPVAIDLLQHSDDQIAYRVARLMVDLKFASPQVVPALLTAAKSESGLLANAAIRSLGHFSEQSLQIIPVLKQLEQKPDKAASPKVLQETLEQLQSR